MVCTAFLCFAGVAHADFVNGLEQTSTPESFTESPGWDIWEAGELPPAMAEPWKEGCTDKWCPSLVEGVDKGENWCLAKDGCGGYHRKESYALYMKYKPWFNNCGGTPGLWAAQTGRTESEGETDAHIENTGECGLMSVDEENAKALNINSCDPKAVIWAACYGRNNQLINLREDLKGLDSAPIQDQWMLAGAAGAAGSGKIFRIVKWSKALSSKHPYSASRNYLRGLHSKWKKATEAKYWIKKLGLDAGLGRVQMPHEKWLDLEKYEKGYDKNSEWGVLWNAGVSMYRPGRTAFRIARPEGARKVIEILFADGKMPWGDPVLPPRPPDLYSFPGKGKHCACHLWPELKDRVPTPEEFEQWKSQNEPADPANLKCVKGYKGKLACKIVEGSGEKSSSQ